ncbi:family S53 protease-like protein [Wolfiporia cocos MD-104 SS10]|uniref:tripeptidyl-peptidase II n=1 Tax=Wolfiporia cocos (strain MD-104) TaxID=742152 RepID=A0A2H3JL74_WOLCO|nr:family S53 protease-like protein [Wolfiporia cocos MD-104 SS10]
MFFSGTIVAALCMLAQGTPLSLNLQVHESRASVPKGFILQGPASSDMLLSLRIALAQNNVDGLIAALYEVSTPTSSLYGQHLSKAEVEQLISPTSETLDAVNDWLNAFDINSTVVSPAGDWLAISVSVGVANELLDTNFSVYTHQLSGQQIIRTLSYSIPTHLKGHVELVHPTITFSAAPFKSSLSATRVSLPDTLSSEPSACEQYVDPACLQALYGIPMTPATETSNQIGVTGYGEEWANEADLDQFLGEFRPDMSNNVTFVVDTIDGGENNQDPSWAGFEANLDTQYTAGIATDVPVTFLSVGEDNSDGLYGFLDTANYFLSLDNPPSVITTSYGIDEDDVSYALANTLCNAYAQLGARGTSILFSSGDGGVEGNGVNDACSDFGVSFPSSCPYVTSVGATTNFDPETAAYFSSGGFSNYWGIPSFQASAVASYLSYLGDTYAGLYNASGRGYPDVSTQGINFIIVADEQTWMVNGTSCSSPTFAGVIGLLNDRLVAAGKSTLGWMNPFLYSSASAFTDITSGDNPGCGTNGFSAIAGWDPVTGLGTPNFAALLTAVGL